MRQWPSDANDGCSGLHKLKSHEAKCSYLISNSQCSPEGYIDYLHLFYCICGGSPVFGYSILVLWLILLFYLLGNTTACYFCSNLEALSKLLKLSPAIAGVTLLSLGNGAPDVFSSIVSFMGAESTNLVGLNCVLGGAFFVSSVVVGIISICTTLREITIDKACFIRDACFLLFVLLILLAILVYGKINLWSAMAFSSLYLVYVFLVSVTHIFSKEEEPISYFDSDPILPTKGELYAPLVSYKVEQKPNKLFCYFSRILCFLELPLYLPRRLTIPDINEERWSKPFAVISVTLSPMLLAALCASNREELGSKQSLLVSLSGVIIGVTFGVTAIVKTDKERPPTRIQFPWLAGGFLMSVTWTYILAEELVSLLVSFGVILSISPSILGLTVLAWGNSLSDLIANVSVAVNGGSSGVQVAISACYGGPIFNTLSGLGISFVLFSWAGYPSPRVIPKDTTLFQTIGFLIAGLLWALVVLPRRGMKLDRVLGAGLICVYLCFLSVSIGQSLGLTQHPG
ncbi:uncharacterized protein A4U43_C05F17090 [Asparagus officinalis]|uniref:Sodium/calcium exchanger membrane region domain-containing protein n=1 Tax=Asparagus officinalis TaxID=4686 RepID=A0A5P1ES64_ASPOF|nr:cation/calcium exchanger 1-like [Asparagus officinalis]XP_020268491.1 cation/calcium exchanger 1-like [Asparagus officinalis]XP_020268492.1 cation/calcium exchanger 1-like [Asparagus officinalis]ONK68888.1 uncharacterized protein A4U43_C05F17090 [Asparagus officinalis]